MTGTPPSAVTQSRFLSTACAVGDRLVGEAFWHEELCNWVGHAIEEMDDRTLAVTPTVAALDADLYGGSAGVGLFLAELYPFSGASEHRRAARGALLRSLGSAPIPEATGLGFYSGALGIAYAALRGALRLGDDDLRQRAERFSVALCQSFAAAARGEGGGLLDIIGGLAGSVLGLLSLSRLLSTDEARALAEQTALGLGEQLLRAGTPDADDPRQWLFHEAGGLFGDAPLAWPLTGYSHGAAGLALALFELAEWSARADFLAAALGAVAYEDRWFSAEQQNWPDLRPPLPGQATEGNAGWGLSWCHGAPGIGLGRARMLARLQGSPAAPAAASRAQLAADLSAALATTEHSLASRAWPARSDATLCHGAAGLGELLLVAGHELGQAAERQAAAHLGDDLAAEWERHGDWLTGVATGGKNPSLMVGRAGVGYFLLRLHAPDVVPSILLSPASAPPSPQALALETASHILSH